MNSTQYCTYEMIPTQLTGDILQLCLQQTNSDFVETLHYSPNIIGHLDMPKGGSSSDNERKEYNLSLRRWLQNLHSENLLSLKTIKI